MKHVLALAILSAVVLPGCIGGSNDSDDPATTSSGGSDGGANAVASASAPERRRAEGSYDMPDAFACPPLDDGCYVVAGGEPPSVTIADNATDVLVNVTWKAASPVYEKVRVFIVFEKKVVAKKEGPSPVTIEIPGPLPGGSYALRFQPASPAGAVPEQVLKWSVEQTAPAAAS
jgi:hypothetical protein